MNFQNRYNELLLRAYDVIDDTDHFDAFLDQANRYFFQEDMGVEIHSDIPNADLDHDYLEQQSTRLSRLLERSIELENSANDRFHAIIEVSLIDGLARGNGAAAKLLETSFPCEFEDLPLDRKTQKLISANSKKVAEDTIVLAQVEHEDVKPCLALIQRPADRNETIKISISYIDWSPSLLNRLGSAFNLSSAETEVLHGFLLNQSQREIATERARSYETVKAQSKSILQKTNCAKMSEVVKLSASIAYLLRQMPQTGVGSAAEPWDVPTANMKRLERTGNRTLAYYEYGSGPIAVLFIHGYISGPFFPTGFLQACAMQGIRLICPSRPGFGYSTASGSRADFDQTVVEDACALIEHLNLSELSMMVHQGGASHGFRIAGALGDKVKSMFLLDAGIPINETDHLEHMDKMTRMAAMAARYAPSVFKMILSMGMKYYKKTGAETYIRAQFSESPRDIKALDTPAVLRLQSDGCYHIIKNGAETMIRDGNSAMADWEADLQVVEVPQLWFATAEGTIMSAQAVQRKIDPMPNREVVVIPNEASMMLFTSPKPVLKGLVDALHRGGLMK